jgi:hypothetical protein
MDSTKQFAAAGRLRRGVSCPGFEPGSGRAIGLSLISTVLPLRSPPDAQEPGRERVQRAALPAAYDGGIEALLKLADSASRGLSNSPSKCRGYVPCARAGRHAARLAGRCGDH